MNSAALGRAIRDAGKAFLASRIGDLYERRSELEDEEAIDKIAEAYYRKQVGHYDSDVSETKRRILSAKEIIDEDRTVDCLEILIETKSLKPNFRMMAKNTLKKIEG